MIYEFFRNKMDTILLVIISNNKKYYFHVVNFASLSGMDYTLVEVKHKLNINEFFPLLTGINYFNRKEEMLSNIKKEYLKIKLKNYVSK